MPGSAASGSRLKKQIVFYVDDGFPWRCGKKHIFEAVEQWNEPFERIGFKRAILAKPYPKDDPRIRPRQHQVFVHSLRADRHRQRHGAFVGRSAQRRDTTPSVYVYHDMKRC